jgi:hypothetical protein
LRKSFFEKKKYDNSQNLEVEKKLNLQTLVLSFLHYQHLIFIERSEFRASFKKKKIFLKICKNFISAKKK